ncbi:MAG: hypothetical protein E7460_02605 [Ruminococcaceae bacterium]|nr:hypothetical protein [Oscillospiraceae bacterium]
MKKLIATVLFLCLALSACGDTAEAACFTSESRLVKRTMLSKYYISSAENTEEELWADFENRLYVLSKTLGFTPGKDALAARQKELYYECCEKARALGIAPEKYARQEYFTSYVLPDEDFGPGYFYNYAVADLCMEFSCGYLAEVWGLSENEALADQLVSEGLKPEKANARALRAEVFRYSVEHSKTVMRPKSPKFFVLRTDIADILTSNGQFLRPVYAVDENGYAALYDVVFTVDSPWPEPYLGKRIAGSTGCDGIYRVRGMEDELWLIVRRNGEYALCYFVDWISADSEDYDAFVAIYGTEPKLHP